MNLVEYYKAWLTENIINEGVRGRFERSPSPHGPKPKPRGPKNTTKMKSTLSPEDRFKRLYARIQRLSDRMQFGVPGELRYAADHLDSIQTLDPSIRAPDKTYDEHDAYNNEVLGRIPGRFRFRGGRRY
jgi:hypothetical protein